MDVLCFDLVYFTRPAQFVILSFGVFFFYLLYGYYQELIFSLPGFSGYGWYLTLIQFGYYSVFGKVGLLFLFANEALFVLLICNSGRDVSAARREEGSPEDLHLAGAHHGSHHGLLQRQLGSPELPHPGDWSGCPGLITTLYCMVVLQTKAIRRFVITEKAPTRASSWLKAATTAFTFKTLLRHYSKRALTPRSLNVKLGPRRKGHKGRAVWLA